MKIIFISFLFIFCCVEITDAQSLSNGLFILLDRSTDSVRENLNRTGKISYSYHNDKEKWNLNFQHINIPGDKRNHFRYLLPKEMVEEYKRKGNVQEAKGLMEELNEMNLPELNKYFKLRYSYFFEYLNGKKYKTQTRYNVFLFFKSDLEKDYVQFYEVSITTSRSVEVD